MNGYGRGMGATPGDRRSSWLPGWRQRAVSAARPRLSYAGSTSVGGRRPSSAQASSPRSWALRLPEKGLAYRPPCPCGGRADRMPCVLNRTDRLRTRLALDRTCCATNRVYRSPNRSRQQSASKTHRESPSLKASIGRGLARVMSSFRAVRPVFSGLPWSSKLWR
jgi:hypothetical protein